MPDGGRVNYMFLHVLYERLQFSVPTRPSLRGARWRDCEASFAAAILPQGWALADRLSFCFGHTLLVAGTVENDARKEGE